jgi:hypothetical protein
VRRCLSASNTQVSQGLGLHVMQSDPHNGCGYMLSGKTRAAATNLHPPTVTTMRAAQCSHHTLVHHQEVVLSRAK